MFLGGDIDLSAVSSTAINTRSLGRVNLQRWDARRLPLADAAVDRIISNPPFGKQLETVETVGPLYRKMVVEYDRILRPKGKAVLLVSEQRLLQAAASAVNWKLLEKTRVRVLGQGGFHDRMAKTRAGRREVTLDPLAAPPLDSASLPGIGGKIKHQPEDFEVEEVPAYEPSGAGPFLYLWLEKRDLGAEFFVREIARRLDLGTGEIGMAGLKDRRAVSRQWVSVPEAAESNLARLEGAGIRVLQVSRHTNKLRTGHLRGNRFNVLVRDPASDAATLLTPLLDRFRHQGFPNFYGPQRFGRNGETALLGLDLLQNKQATARRPGPFLRNWRCRLLRRCSLTTG